jgi:hypothetical protein
LNRPTLSSSPGAEVKGNWHRGSNADGTVKQILSSRSNP